MDERLTQTGIDAPAGCDNAGDLSSLDYSRRYYIEHRVEDRFVRLTCWRTSDHKRLFLHLEDRSFQLEKNYWLMLPEGSWNIFRGPVVGKIMGKNGDSQIDIQISTEGDRPEIREAWLEPSVLPKPSSNF